MHPAYRIPLGKCPLVSRFTTQDTATNTPITEMVVNSLITSHGDGAQIKAGSTINVGGIAWDGGYGIRTVEVSIDGGKSWARSEEHTSELQSRQYLVCRLLLEKKKKQIDHGHQRVTCSTSQA